LTKISTICIIDKRKSLIDLSFLVASSWSFNFLILPWLWEA